jgi:hypothetical protein
MEDRKDNVQKEVDLSELLGNIFTALGRGISYVFNNLLKAFAYLFLYGIRNWLPLTGFLVVGVVYGIFQYYTGDKVVLSDMLIRNNETPNAEMISKINNLSIYAQQKNYVKLKETLNIDENHAKALNSIGAYWLIDSDYDGVPDYVDYKNNFNQLEDTTLRRIQKIISIRVKTSTPEILGTLKNGLFDYLNKDEELVRLNVARTNTIKDMVAKISVELAELDQLQDYEYFKKDKESTIDLGKLGSLRLKGEEKDTRLLHEEVLSLEQRRLDMEKELAVNGSIFTVIKDFAISEQPEKTAFQQAVINGIMALILGFIVIFIFCHRKNVLRFMEEKVNDKE